MGAKEKSDVVVGPVVVVGWLGRGQECTKQEVMPHRKQKINVAIVDDDYLISQLLAKFLRQSGEIEVTMSANGGVEFFDLLDENPLPPDVVLLDLRMENGNGIEVLKELERREIFLKVIVLTSFYRLSFTGQILKLGARAFVSKATSPMDLLKTIVTVHEKGHHWTREQIQALRSQIVPKSPEFHLSSKNGLTKREIEVLQLICLQMTTHEIASYLCLSPKTVETHKGNLVMKTAVRNMVGLVIYAIQNRIVDPEEIILLER